MQSFEDEYLDLVHAGNVIAKERNTIQRKLHMNDQVPMDRGFGLPDGAPYLADASRLADHLYECYVSGVEDDLEHLQDRLKDDSDDLSGCDDRRWRRHPSCAGNLDEEGQTVECLIVGVPANFIDSAIVDCWDVLAQRFGRHGFRFAVESEMFAFARHHAWSVNKGNRILAIGAWRERPRRHGSFLAIENPAAASYLIQMTAPSVDRHLAEIRPGQNHLRCQFESFGTILNKRDRILLVRKFEPRVM